MSALPSGNEHSGYRNNTSILSNIPSSNRWSLESRRNQRLPKRWRSLESTKVGNFFDENPFDLRVFKKNIPAFHAIVQNHFFGGGVPQTLTKFIWNLVYFWGCCACHLNLPFSKCLFENFSAHWLNLCIEWMAFFEDVNLSKKFHTQLKMRTLWRKVCVSSIYNLYN